MAIVLLMIPFLPFAETIDFDNLPASLQNAGSALDIALLAVLGVPFVLVLLIMV